MYADKEVVLTEQIEKLEAEIEAVKLEKERLEYLFRCVQGQCDLPRETDRLALQIVEIICRKAVGD